MTQEETFYAKQGILIKAEYNPEYISENDISDFDEDSQDYFDQEIESENDNNDKTSSNIDSYNFHSFFLNNQDSKSVRAYSPKAQLLIYNIFLYFYEKLGYTLTKSMKETNKSTGVSIRTIHKIKHRINLGLELDWKKVRKPFYKNSRKVKYSNKTIHKIKEILENLAQQKAHFTLNDVLAKVNENSQLPNFKKTTLVNLFNDNGIFFKRSSGNKGVFTFKK